jgi:DNA-binding response OmpR family regulator
MADIVVLEDGQPLLRLMSWALNEEGFAVSSVEDFAAALEQAGLEQPRAFISNSAGSPSQRREEFQRLRAAAPGAIIIELYEGEEPDTGADAFVSAPFAVRDVMAAIGDGQKDGKGPFDPARGGVL